MQQVALIQEANILVPNPEHQNFTDTGRVIPVQTELKGEFVKINGKRRGKPFQYRVFKLAGTNEFIYSNLTKTLTGPMETEVKLGADAGVTPTKVTVPSNKLADRAPLIGAIAGAAIGYGISKYRKETKPMNIGLYVLITGVIGYYGGKMVANRKKVSVTPSK